VTNHEGRNDPRLRIIGASYDRSGPAGSG
jgi:hypothetical protein